MLLVTGSIENQGEIECNKELKNEMSSTISILNNIREFADSFNN